jgi:hypothetical protein
MGVFSNESNGKTNPYFRRNPFIQPFYRLYYIEVVFLMTERIITVIKAYDHFTTNRPIHDEKFLEEVVIAEGIGEIIGETDVYIILSHWVGDINENDSPHDLHYIIKSAIIERKDVEI